MPFSRKLLHEDERVLVETRQHWSLLFFPIVELFVVFGGVAAVFVIWSSAPAWFGWVLLAVALVAAGYFLVRLFQWRSAELVVTSQRVIYRRGAFHRIGREIPLSNVQNVEYRQSIRERMLRKGRLTVESAGAHGSEPFTDIPRAAHVQSVINRAIDDSHHRQPEAEPPTEQVSLPDEFERLADLHRRGVITDDEFARLKGDLIDEHQAPREGG